MTRSPTIEWQVCGICNYDCSYCIQSKGATGKDIQVPQRSRAVSRFLRS